VCRFEHASFVFTYPHEKYSTFSTINIRLKEGFFCLFFAKVEHRREDIFTMTSEELTRSLIDAFANVWGVFAGLIYAFSGTVLILLVGLFLAAGLGKLVEKIFDGIRLDNTLENAGLKPIFERANLRVRVAYFIGRVVYWFVVLSFLLMIADFLQLEAFSIFLQQILAYLPNILVAVLILAAAAVIAQFLKKVVRASAMSAHLHSANFLGTLAWWAVAVFGLFAALLQLQVAESIVNALITGFIAMISLAGGLAFGLGGKDYASHLLNKLREETENRR